MSVGVEIQVPAVGDEDRELRIVAPRRGPSGAVLTFRRGDGGPRWRHPTEFARKPAAPNPQDRDGA